MADRRVSKYMDEETVRMIRRLAKAGVRQQDIAEAAGVCRATIYKVVRRDTWKHVE